MLSSAIKLMRVTTAITVMGALSGLSTASAATLVNRDTTAHKIVVVEDGARQEIVLEGSQQVSDLCRKTCELYLNSDPEPYELATSDKLEIEEGALYYQEAPAPQPSQ